MMYVFLLVGFVCTAAVFYFFLRRRPHALIVLVYEKAGTPPPNSRLKNEWINPHAFETMLQRLKSRRFTPVSLEKIAEGKLPQKPVLLAFMGGYQSFITDIFPLLEKHQTQAAVFIPPALMSTYNGWQDPHQEPWQNLLTEKQLKILQKSGLVSFGALGLEAEDLTQRPQEYASYSARESLFRLKTQLGLKPNGFAFWPAAEFDAQRAARILPENFKAPVLTPRIGVNKRMGKHRLLKVLFPAKNPLRVRYALWKHR